MKVLFFASMATILGLTIATGSALAGVISNGALSVTIRNDNGAIDTAEFDGIDYFNPGTPVSDFGFQNGTTTSTFARNNTSGFTDQPVTVSGTSVSGVYSGGGAN